MSGSVKLVMNDINKILRDKGLDSNGKVQSFHTNNVLRRIIKFMPFDTGATIKMTIAQTNINKPEIVTDAPYAKYLFHGKVMVGEAPKQLTDIPLTYSHHKNPQAGPYWDRRLVAAEDQVIAAELQRYINRR
ncbi:MAG: minor capsid protein [Angelakisella sp.]